MIFTEGLALASIVISLASLGASVYTLWMVHMRRGQLKLTQPTMLFFGRDFPHNTPKIWLRTLLFSTSARGQIIESLFLRVSHPITGEHLFDFWSHGEKGQLSRGSGLFVGQTGVVQDNHFLLRRGAPDFLFWDGDYRITVCASILGRRKPTALMEVAVTLDGQQSAELIQILDAGIFFDWDAEAHLYTGHVERHPQAAAARVSPLDRPVPAPAG